MWVPPGVIQEKQGQHLQFSGSLGLELVSESLIHSWRWLYYNRSLLPLYHQSALCQEMTLQSKIKFSCYFFKLKLNPLNPGSDYSRFYVIYTCYWIYYKLNESQIVITSSIQEVVKVLCQDYKAQLLNHSIISIEPIIGQFPTGLDSGVQVAMPINDHIYLLMKFPWPGQCKRVTLDW